MYIFIFIKIFAFLRPLWPPKPRKTFLLHNGVYWFAIRASGGAEVPCLTTWIVDIYLSAVILLTSCLTKGQRESPIEVIISWVHDTNFQKFPRRTETAIASIAGRSPAFCEFLLIWVWQYLLYLMAFHFFDVLFEIQGIRKIMLVLLYSWNWIISYDEKCFKHLFLEFILT